MSTKKRKIINLNISHEFFNCAGVETWEPPAGWTIIQICPQVDSYDSDRIFVLHEEIEPELSNDKKKL